MKKKVDIRVELDPTYEVPEVVIKTAKETELIEKIVYTVERCLSGEYPQVAAYSGDTVVLLNQREIVRVYTENRRVIICTEKEEYDSKLTLRDLEEMLDERYFVRISRFEIVNLRKIFSFDLNITGTIRITFVNKTETWVARRYVKTISDKLKEKSKGGRAQ